MVSISPDDLRLENAIEATKGLYLRDLPAHVCVGPMPPGALNALELPLKNLDLSSPPIKHFVDLITDVPKGPKLLLTCHPYRLSSGIRRGMSFPRS